jgi:hypothetical protein
VVVSSFVVRHLRLRPPCPCLLFVVRRSPFHCPSSLAASTCNPPHEQWLAGLGWVLTVRCCSSITITHPGARSCGFSSSRPGSSQAWVCRLDTVSLLQHSLYIVQISRGRQKRCLDCSMMRVVVVRTV